MRGRFITFEGGEGSGKSTQIGLLATRLREAGRQVVVTREPGGTQAAEAVRTLLVTGDADALLPMSEALLVNAARAEHVARLIRPRLAAGDDVLCDRYVDSTLAYQGAGKGIDRAKLEALHAMATGGLYPDLTLVFQLPVGTGLARSRTRAGQLGRGQRFEAHGGDFHDRVAAGFVEIVRDNPDRCRLIDAAGSIEAVAGRIWECVEALPC